MARQPTPCLASVRPRHPDAGVLLMGNRMMLAFG